MTEAMWFGLGTIFATFIGPIAAVLVTRWVDHKRERYNRRLELFRTLMRTRRAPLSQEFVGALNLIEVEFYDVPEVIKPWQNMLDILNGPLATSEEEGRRFGERTEYARAVLLSSMAKALRFSVPDLDIFRGGYSPRGWADIESEQTSIRGFMAQVASGKRPVPITLLPAVAPPAESQDAQVKTSVPERKDQQPE